MSVDLSSVRWSTDWHEGLIAPHGLMIRGYCDRCGFALGYYDKAYGSVAGPIVCADCRSLTTKDA